MNEHEKLIILTSIFVSALITANFVAGVKLVNLLGLVVPCGFLAYCITFPITDIVSEVWGRRVSHHVVWAGFIANLIMLSLVYIGLVMPPLTPEMQEIYSKAFTPVARIVFASMLAYLISQHHDVWSFHFWRELTKGKWLWLRNNASTAVSQLIDTVIFITVAFYGTVPLSVLVNIIWAQWLWKLVIALIDTPFVYVGVSLVRTGLTSVDKFKLKLKI